MGALLRTILFLIGLMCCIQYVHMARQRRDGSSVNSGKSADNLDVNALGSMIMNRLKDSLKDGGDSVKNIVNSASNKLQQRGGVIRASVAALM